MSEVKENPSHIKDQLHSDLKCVLTDVELLLKAIANRTGEQATSVRDRLDGNLKGALERLAKIDATLVGDVKQQVHAALHETSEAVKLVANAAVLSARASEDADALHAAEATRKTAHNAIEISQESIMRAIQEIVRAL